MGQSTSDTQVAESGAGGSKTVKKSKLASVVSGSMSGAIVSSCVQPLDVIRTKMQADSAHGVTRSTAQTIALIAKDGGGLMTFWRGTQPTVIRLAIGAGLHFTLLETIKPWFEKKKTRWNSTYGCIRCSTYWRTLTRPCCDDFVSNYSSKNENGICA